MAMRRPVSLGAERDSRVAVHIEGVSKRFTTGGREIEALGSTSLAISAGEFVSVVGPSGCGKSTLLRLVAGLDAPSSGRIEIGRDRPGDGRGDGRVGFVFQDPVLLPWLSALENVRFPLDTSSVGRAEADRTARAMLALVGLQLFEDALPKALSGGMRQRVSIARALSYDPALLLMDEPFGALDLLTRDRLNDELLRIWTATGKTIILVTHSVEEAAYLSDRVFVMSARPGVIKKVYSVDLERPRGEVTKLDPRFHTLMAALRRDLA